MSKAAPQTIDLLSIGDLGKAAGIAPDTIRVWERRYGRPEAVRLPSGHRRYTPEDVRWLRRVAEALAHGHRPSKVVHLSDAELDDLVAPVPESAAHQKAIQRQLELVRTFRLSEFRRELEKEWKKRGPDSFLKDRMAPLLTAVGRAWADGVLSIRHEHALTYVAEDLLRNMRQGLPKPRGGPLLVLATLPDELHALGLLMVAVAATRAGVRVHELGPNVPLDEIVEAVRETKAKGVGLSVSLATGGIQTDRQLADLRQRLPVDVQLVIGGAGARGVRRGPRGVQYVADFEELGLWLTAFCEAGRPKKKASQK